MTNDHLYDAFDSELVLVGAPDDDALLVELDRLAGFLEQAPGVPLEDVAYTCAKRAVGQGAVVAIVADSVGALLSRLKTVAPRIRGGAARVRDKSGTYYFREHLAGKGASGKLAFLFPGATSFYPDMLRDLAILFPVCRAPFDELEEAMKEFPPFSPSSFVFPPAERYRRDATVFAAGGYAQNIVSAYSANSALYRLFCALGVRPQGVFGFSGGDLSALAVAGAFGEFPRGDRVKFLRDYYALVDRAVDRAGLPKCEMYSAFSMVPGQLASCLAEYTADQVAVAFNQSPRQHTVALRPEIAADALKGFADSGVRVIRLPVDRPFNTPWCEAIIPEFRKFGKRWVGAKLSLPCYSCATARPCDGDRARRVRDETAEQWAQPVRFDETVRRMADDGYRIFLEVGPRGSMCASVEDVLRGSGCVAVAANRVNRSGLLQLHHALGHLAALGVAVDATCLHARRRRHLLDLDSPLLAVPRADSEMRLSRSLPRVMWLSDDSSVRSAPPGRIGKAAQRDLAVQRREARRSREPIAGDTWPLLHDSETVSVTPGVSIEVEKLLDLSELRFLRDCAYGASRVSYSDEKLTGLTMLTLSAGIEMMAELARELVPNLVVVRVEDANIRRAIHFSKGQLKVSLKAERVASSEPGVAAVKVQIRDDAPNVDFTWAVMECTVFLASAALPAEPAVAGELSHPRSVHWTPRDIYPERLRYGNTMQSVAEADLWSEIGLDYEVSVPEGERAIRGLGVPVWEVNPLALESVVSGVELWRSHERFGGNFMMPFRIRRLTLYVTSFGDRQRLKCYLRLTSATPRSHICDVTVSDGNGNLLMTLSALEEYSQRVPIEYRQMYLTPSSTFLTQPLPAAEIGSPKLSFAGSLAAEVPFAMFEKHGEMWLDILSRVTLCRAERATLANMSGSAARRTEWLFGRIAAKEAVRRYMLDNCQARWTSADVEVWPDERGKPTVLGDWADYVPGKLDVSIAHTSRLVVAVVVANARIGIDIEALGRDLSDEFLKGVFTDEEQALAADAIDPPATLLRFWCAKEAVSKALGTGIRYSPLKLNIRSYDPETGAMSVRLEGPWLDEFKLFTGREIAVTSRVLRDHALCSCILPASLFATDD